jgi:hypothetical protein
MIAACILSFSMTLRYSFDLTEEADFFKKCGAPGAAS